MNAYAKQRRMILAMAATVALAGCTGTPTRESMGNSLEDTAITSKVKTALLADKGVNGAAIKVEAYKGIVQLSGFVKSRREKDRAAQVAGSVKGVEAIKNDLLIK